jgi:hypothetical protein
MAATVRATLALDQLGQELGGGLAKQSHGSRRVRDFIHRTREKLLHEAWRRGL